MRIECIKDKLVQAVAKVEKITGKNISLPVLSCILLEAKGGVLKLKATNLDLGIEYVLPAKIEVEGTVAVPGSVFNNFISNIKDVKNIKLEEKDGNLLISTENNEAVIKTLPIDDFPSIPSISDGENFLIQSNDFIRGLKSVLYSASISTIKPELSSVYIHSGEEEMIFAATDSFRLGEKRIRVKKIPENLDILVPFKNVADFLKVLDDSKEDLNISFNKNQISLTCGSLYLVSRIIDGNFPDYQQIIPKEYKTEVIVLKQDLLNALKISNFFSDSFNQINIKVLLGEKRVAFKTKNSNIGETVNKISANLAGEEIEVNFNQKYIVDCFQSIDSDSISLQFNGINRPLLIKGVSDKSFLYIVMPMNK